LASGSRRSPNLHGFWEDAARRDPLWAILSDPSKRHRTWALADFFATGRREISLLLHQLETLGTSPRRGTALDFGCGVGRLTQALALTFDHVIGVDAAPTMIRLARQLNRHGDRVRYLLNDRPDLSILPGASLDLIYSDIVLQHIPPEQARNYLTEFLRLLTPGGIAVFQLTAERRSAAATRIEPMPDDAYRAALAVEGLPPEMEPGAQSRIIATVTNVSRFVWDPDRCGALRVGNHWLDAAGAMLIQDDGRASIAGELGPGEKQRIALTVEAPRAAGLYRCEVDAVHEGVTWFADRGSAAWRGDVRVGDATGSVQAAAPPDESYPDIYETIDDNPPEIGDFPMFGIPRAEVVDLITSRGGCFFHVEPDERGGPEWTGYRYFIVNEGR